VRYTAGRTDAIGAGAVPQTGRLPPGADDTESTTTGGHVDELEGVLGPSVTKFVERYVRSLLTWDIIVFFHRNPEAVLDLEGLAARLGRQPDEIRPEVEGLGRDKILQFAGGLVRYRPDADMRAHIATFVQACQDRGRRLALIALVLHKIRPTEG
jgi:hypothetical protein